MNMKMMLRRRFLAGMASVCFCGFFLSDFCRGAEYFPPGVTSHSGFYDINKLWPNGNPPADDSMLCWAAASSNAIQFFQARYGVFYEGEKALIHGTVNGDWSRSLIFQYFRDSFKDIGGMEHGALEWWMRGIYNPEDVPELRPGAVAPGFWKDWYGEDSCVEYMVVNKTVPYLGGVLSHYLSHYGPVPIAVYSDLGLAHAITAWGCELDEEGRLVKLWLTDSDDEYPEDEGFDPARERMFSADVRIGEDGRVYLGYYLHKPGDLGDVYIGSCSFLKVPAELESLQREYAASDLTWTGTSLVWEEHEGKGDIPGLSAGWSAEAGGRAWNSFYENGRRVVFGNAGTSASGAVVTLNGELAPSSVLVDSRWNYRLSGQGSLTGSMSLTKRGSGTLDIRTNNTYTGDSILEEGVLCVGHREALGKGCIRAYGGTLDLNGFAVGNGLTVERGNVQLKGADQFAGDADVAGGQLIVDYGSRMESLRVGDGAVVLQGAPSASGEHGLYLAGNLAVEKEGTLTLIMSGINQDKPMIEVKGELTMQGRLVADMDGSVAYSDAPDCLQQVILGGDAGAEGAGVAPDVGFGTLIFKYYARNSLHVTGGTGAPVMLSGQKNAGAFYADSKINGSLGDMGLIGGTMLDGALHACDPQKNTASSVLAGIMNTMDGYLVRGEYGKAEDTLSALAGNSVTSLSASFADRFASAMRTCRTAIQTVNRAWSVELSGEYRARAWVLADGARRELDSTGSRSGYTLDTWAGTLGADVRISSLVTLGVALSAETGDLKTRTVDSARGDIDSSTLDLYMLVEKDRWSHALVLSGSRADMELKRSIPAAAQSRGATTGYACGATYELAYRIPLDGSKDRAQSLSPVLDISWSRAHVGGYRESGLDGAGLGVGGQTVHFATWGAGVKYSGAFSSSFFGLPCLLDGRIMVLQDVGSRQGQADVNMQADPGHRFRLRGSKPGRTRMELGGGLGIPLRENDSIFVNLNGEWGARVFGISGALGYRVQF